MIIEVSEDGYTIAWESGGERKTASIVQLIDAFEAEPIMYDTGSWQTTVTDLPPVEYAPIKHGRWIEDEYGIPHCSECKAINNTVYRNYCPNCGARMDETVETYTINAGEV